MVEQEVIDCMNDMIKTLEQREKNRQYYLKNKDKVLEKRKEHYDENRNNILQYKKVYNKTDHARKLRRINQWQHQGIICDNWDALYDHYLKTSFCDLCKVVLTYDTVSTATTKCVDHDHSITDRPNFRAILCNCCNINRRSD